MKRIYFVIVLLYAFALPSIGQSDNILNTLILKSVIDYTYVIIFAKLFESSCDLTFSCSPLSFTFAEIIC